MPTEELTVELADEGNRLTLKVRGDLDLLTVGRLRTALADVSGSESTTVVIVDLAEVRHFGALTVGLFARAARQLRRNGCCLLVSGVTPFQERFMRVCGLRQVVGTRRRNTRSGSAWHG
jgi:anti-anti-sigma factor